MPSFIKDPWDPSNIPPTKSGKFPAGVEPSDGTNCLVNWILNSPDLRTDRKDQIEAVKSFLAKEYNVTNKVGAVGMCWGAKVCFNAADKGLVDAVAACHGSFLNKDDAEQCDVPMCLLNSKDEPELYEKDIKPVMDSKPFKDKNVFKNYSTMHHGVSRTDCYVFVFCLSYATCLPTFPFFFSCHTVDGNQRHRSRHRFLAAGSSRSICSRYFGSHKLLCKRMGVG